MDLVVRPARPEDACAQLLFESARPYYTAYAGNERRALKLLRRVFTHPGHAASYEYTQVAVTVDSDEIVAVLSGFPVRDGEWLSRRFVRLTLPRVPPWSLPGTLRHLHAAGDVAPNPPHDAYYVDALAVDGRHRRQGIAQHLLKVAEYDAAQAGCRRLALDTGLQNVQARALYDAYGFWEREIRRAPSTRVANALGGPGFVGYLKDI